MSLAALFARSDRWQARQPAVGLPVAVAKKFVEDDAAGLGVQVAYWGFFSVFSLLLAFHVGIGLRIPERSRVPKACARLNVATDAGDRTPARRERRVSRGKWRRPRCGARGWVWTGLGVTLAIGNALDRIWAVGVRERRGFVKSRLRGLVVLAPIGAMTVATTAAVGVAATGGAESAVARVLSFTAGVCVDLVVFLASFRLLTAAVVTDPSGVAGGGARAAGCCCRRSVVSTSTRC